MLCSMSDAKPRTPLLARVPAWARSERALLWLTLAAATVFFLWLQGVPDDPKESLEEIIAEWNAGEWADTKDYARWGTYLFAWVNVATCGLLALTLPIWQRRTESKAINAKPLIGGKWFWLGMGVAVLLGGGLRWSTATGGLWHDELLNAQRINGYYKFDKKDPLFGDVTFREAKWVDTAFYYRKPTNHVAFSVPSRITHSAWQKLTGADRSALNPFYLRLPSYLAALGSILLLGLILRRWNLASAGVIAALLLAIHPWAIRWSVDARSYGLTMFFLLCAVYAVTRIAENNRWRWWALFGFSQAYLMWLSVLNVFLAAPLALVLTWIIFRRAKQQNEPLIDGLGRLVFVNLLAACAFLQVMGPNLIQFQQYNDFRPPSEAEYLQVDADNLKDTATNWLIGLPHKLPVEVGDAPITTFLSRYSEDSAIVGTTLAAGILLFTLAGLVMLAMKSSSPARLSAIAIFVGGVSLLLISWIQNLYFYPRFLAYMVIPLAIGCAVCWTGITRPLAKLSPKMKTLAPLLGGIVGLIYFTALALPQIDNLARNEHEPLPRISAAVKNYAASNKVTPLAAGYGLGSDILADLIDPDIRFIENRKELETMMAKSRETQRPLLVTYGVQSFNRKVLPDGFVLLDDSKYFTRLERFVSNDPRHTFFLYEYTGKP